LEQVVPATQGSLPGQHSWFVPPQGLQIVPLQNVPAWQATPVAQHARFAWPQGVQLPLLQ
jgi:hypothetical protein